jgi:lysophospholipase L1-like esterase
MRTKLLTFASVLLTVASAAAQDNRWESAIREFETRDKAAPPPQGEVVFVGSSSVRRWNLAESFPAFACINRGFGGSQMADSVHYAHRIITPYRPRVVVVYAGDNDIAAGKTPDVVAADAKTLAATILTDLPNSRVVFVSIKPSIARWQLFEKMQEANRLIAEFTQQDPRIEFVDVTRAMLGDDSMPRPELFVADSLHLSAAGYRVWSSLVAPHLTKRATPGDVSAKRRLIVLTDIGGDPDDQQSLVRLLTYSNEFDVEAMIATGRLRHGADTRADLIRQAVQAYGTVRPNLAEHAPNFPAAELLLERIHSGQPLAGPNRPVTDSIGAGKRTAASNAIVAIVDKPDARPVWIIIWGGSADLAQALWQVAHERSPDELAAFKSKLRVFAIHDQDSTGPWIKQTHLDLFYITAYHGYRGMYRDGDTALVTRDWVRAHVNGHGPLGNLYPNYDGGDPWGNVRGVKEGDTPSLLYLLPTGLGNPERPTWGSWGGRFSGVGPQFADAKDTVGDERSERATVHRWRRAYQNSFAARMAWCTRPKDAANHEPVALIDGPAAQTVVSGTHVALSAAGSTDPDGNNLAYSWFHYREPGSFSGPLTIEGPDRRDPSFMAPDVDSPCTIHIVLAVTDDGSPPLTHYRRVVVTVVPRPTAMESRP